MKYEPFLMTEYMDRLGHDCAFDLTGSTCEIWRTDDLLAVDGKDVASTLSTALFLDLPGRDAEEFCAQAAGGADLALIPGTLFGNFPSHVRVGYGTSGFTASIGRLEQFLVETSS